MLDENYSQTASDVKVPKTVRLTSDMFDLVTKDVNPNMRSSTLAGPNSARLLRPKSPVRPEKQIFSEQQHLPE